VRETLRAIARIGPSRVARVVAHRAWSESIALGLRADVAQLPPRREAKVPVTMTPVLGEEFTAFRTTEAVDAEDAVELVQRDRMAAGGVATLLVASSEDGAPMYAQWLVKSDAQAPLHRVTGGLFPHLADGEGLLEGAYTFPDFRGLGLMADGMWQLLARARDEGATAVYTYVGPENIASLKGCARVGFELDHVRIARRRAGRTSIEKVAPDAAARAAWAAATG
jgi:GNAT superfamily N-acetyltransferase